MHLAFSNLKQLLLYLFSVLFLFPLVLVDLAVLAWLLIVKT